MSRISIDVQAQVDEAVAALKKLPGALDETGAAAKQTSFSFTELNNAVSLGKQAVQMLGDVYRATIAPTLDAASAQRELALAGQITAEQAGVLIQIGDDLKISTDTLKTAFREMTKDGLQPTLANIKEVAAKYQSIQDPTERLQYAQDALGRSYQAMLPFLEMLPEDLDAATDSAYRAGTVMSNEAVQAAHDYELALANLEDSVHGFVYSVSNEAIPALTEFFNVQNTAVEAQWILKTALDNGIITTDEYARLQLDLYNGVASVSTVIDQLSPKVDTLAAAHRAETEAALATSDAISRHEEALRKEDAALDPLPPKVNTLATAFGNLSLALSGPLKTEEDNFEAKQTALQAQIDQSKTKLGELIAQGYSPIGTKVGEVSATIAEQEATLEANAAKHEEATRRIVFGLAQQKLQAEITSGAIGPEMAGPATEALNQVGLQWGILDKDTMTATANIDAALDKLSGPDGNVIDFKNDLFAVGVEATNAFVEGGKKNVKSASDLEEGLTIGLLPTLDKFGTALDTDLPKQSEDAGTAMGELGDKWEEEYSEGGNLNRMRIETQGLAHDIWYAAEQVRDFPQWPPPPGDDWYNDTPPTRPATNAVTTGGGNNAPATVGSGSGHTFNFYAANDLDIELVARRVAQVMTAA